LPGMVPEPATGSNGGGAAAKRSNPADLALTANEMMSKEPQGRSSEDHVRTQKVFGQILKRRGIVTLKVPAPWVPDEESRRDPCHSEKYEFTRRFFRKLKKRGIHGIRQFRLMCHNMDFGSNGVCLGRGLEGALAHMGVKMRLNEFADLLRLFGNGDADTVNYVEMLAYCCGNISQQRYEIIEEAFEFVKSKCPGSALTVVAIECQFRPQSLTSWHVPDLLEHHSVEEFTSQWSGGVLAADGVVGWADFVDYYMDVSVSIDSEADFCEYVCGNWGIDMDDWVAKKIFRRYASEDDEDSLAAKEFLRMLRELDPDISEDEALAWLDTIDEDDSGEISLQEFLESKVLRVKRLFDRYDDDHSRSLDRVKMMNVLKELNPSISEEEANALYDCADIDGSGEISFCEFLESNLLKLHDVFCEFDTRRCREFGEPEIKTLLRKLDPFLTDQDLHSIYKAIDTDNSGRITFVEFVESHVLRAKTIFDRYDVDRSRSLTLPEFRELLLDMDEQMTQREMEAIYALVSNEETGKVTLGGFLNPNIMKLKLLFDKHDDDNSRTLEAKEFKLMLRELWKQSSERDIEALYRVACPHGDVVGIALVEYIGRFKEVARKHDLIELEKRRAARAKQKSKGLVTA